MHLTGNSYLLIAVQSRFPTLHCWPLKLKLFLALAIPANTAMNVLKAGVGESIKGSLIDFCITFLAFYAMLMQYKTENDMKIDASVAWIEA